MVFRRSLCGLFAALAACRAGEARVQADRRPNPAAPALRLALPGGSVFDLKDQQGKVVLLFFGYTHCPDICPTTLVDFVAVKRRLAERADRVRFVFVSVDPKRDTPDAAQRYVQAFDHSFVGLSGDSIQLSLIQRGFHVASYVERDSTGEYSVAHSASVFLIGTDGRIHDTLRFGEARADEMFAAVDRALKGI